MKPSILIASLLLPFFLALDASAQPSPPTYPTFLVATNASGTTRHEPTFLDDPDYQPVYFGEITGTPKALRPGNPGETSTLLRQTIGISYSVLTRSYAVVVIEQRKTVTSSGRTWTEVFPQTEFFGKRETRETSRRLRLRFRASIFSIISTRSMWVDMDKRRHTGKLRMQFRSGTVTDQRFAFTWVRVNTSSGSAGTGSAGTGLGGSGSRRGAAGALRGATGRTP